MDALGWLRLQIEWGADEALDDLPFDRRAALPAPAAPTLPRPPQLPAPIALGGLAQAEALAASARTPAELREALAGFDGCSLRATATNLVWSDGDPASRLLLVADVPGPAEDRAGVPFAGPNAEFLDQMLASVGLRRAAALAVSMLPWRPPGDRKPADTEVQLCLPFFLRHLGMLAPQRMVLFGGLAARALLPGEGRRGRSGWQSLAVPGLETPVPTLVCSSIAHIRAAASAKREAWGAMMRLRRALDGGAH